jgi:hypothetical protein
MEECQEKPQELSFMNPPPPPAERDRLSQEGSFKYLSLEPLNRCTVVPLYTVVPLHLYTTIPSYIFSS